MCDPPPGNGVTFWLECHARPWSIGLGAIAFPLSVADINCLWRTLIVCDNLNCPQTPIRPIGSAGDAFPVVPASLDTPINGPLSRQSTRLVFLFWQDTSRSSESPYTGANPSNRWQPWGSRLPVVQTDNSSRRPWIQIGTTPSPCRKARGRPLLALSRGASAPRKAPNKLRCNVESDNLAATQALPKAVGLATLTESAEASVFEFETLNAE